MKATSQLLLRNRDLLADREQILWINPPPDSAWRDLGVSAGRLELFCQDYADWRSLAAAGAPVKFGDFPGECPGTDCIVLSLPKEKERLRMLSQLAASLLSESGRLLLVGENSAGIKSSPRQLRPYFGSVSKRDSARHCVLVQGEAPRGGVPFSARDYLETWTLELELRQLQIHSWPGVFAHGALDAGTRLLLDHLPEIASGSRVLDFGCGAGVIAAAMLSGAQHPDCLLCDSSALACRSARATLKANALDATVIASDGFSDIDGSFDLVISNPPFHVGHKSVLNLSPALLGPIRNFLNPGGQFVLVANRHLPYRRWLDGTFTSHRVIAADSRFHVLAATNQQ